ncbi:hypothetical protein NUM3379_22650 [Kineococcus sp. NUM-3379]
MATLEAHGLAYRLSSDDYALMGAEHRKQYGMADSSIQDRRENIYFWRETPMAHECLQRLQAY